VRRAGLFGQKYLGIGLTIIADRNSRESHLSGVLDAVINE